MQTGTRCHPALRYVKRVAEELIGQRAEIYHTDHDGKPAFLIIPRKYDDAAHSKSKVSKPSLETDTEARLSRLESEIQALKKLILNNGGEAATNIKKTSARVGIWTRVGASTA